MEVGNNLCEHTETGTKMIVCNLKKFSYFSAKTNVVGTQKNRLNETVFGHPKRMFKLMDKKRREKMADRVDVDFAPP